MTLQDLLGQASTSGQTPAVTPPPPSSSPSTPMTLEQLLTKNPGSPVITTQPNQTLTPSQQINANYRSGKITAPDAVLQDVGEAASETNQALLSRWSPLGWINDALQGTVGAVGSAVSALAKPLGTSSGLRLREFLGPQSADATANQINKLANSQLVQRLIKTYSNPEVSGDLQAFLNVATLAGTTGAAGAAAESAEALGQSVKPLALNLQENATQNALDNAISAEKDQWSSPANAPRGFLRAQRVLDNATSKGIDVPDVLVKNGIRFADNVENGTFSTSDTASKIREDAGNLSRQLLRPSLQMADYTTPKTAVSDILDQTIEDIHNSKGVTPQDMETQIETAQKNAKALARKYPDGMSLTDMHDEKIAYNQNGKFSPIGDTNVNNTAAVNRAFGRTLASLVEDQAPEGISVKEFNAELQKQYQAADYLDELDGKKVPKTIGAKIRNYIGKGIGAAFGNILGGGILGDVAGYHLGGMIESMLENLPDALRGHFLNNLEMTNPEAFQKVRDYIGQEMTARLQRKLLPAPTSDSPIPLPPSKSNQQSN